MKAYVFRISPMPAPRLTQNVVRGWKNMKYSPTKKIRQKAIIAERYFKYKDALQWEAKSLGFELPCRIDIIQLHIEMPASWTKKKKEEMRGKPHQQVPDFDNYLKGIIDALMKRDGKVWSGKLEKFWTEEGKGRICIYTMTEEERNKVNSLIGSFPIQVVKDSRYA